MICKFCGHKAPSNMQGYCQACYRYFITENKKIHEKPRYGEIKYTSEGDCICPFCGKAFKKLGSHFYNGHGLLSDTAFKLAGWDRNAKATNISYRNVMREKLQDKCVDINLIEKGKATRFKIGSKGRTKDKWSEMSLIRLKKRGKHETNADES